MVLFLKKIRRKVKFNIIFCLLMRANLFDLIEEFIGNIFD